MFCIASFTQCVLKNNINIKKIPLSLTKRGINLNQENKNFLLNQHHTLRYSRSQSLYRAVDRLFGNGKRLVTKEDFCNQDQEMLGITRKGLCRAREVKTCYDSTANATKNKSINKII